MTAPLSAERVKELREWVLYNKGWSNKRNDLLSILSDYSSLRAENEKLISVISFMNESELKAEAEFGSWKKEEVIWKETEAKLLAQLAKQAPLIQAVMETDIFQYHDEDTDCPIIREALKLRSEK